MSDGRFPPDKHYSEPEIIPPGRRPDQEPWPREIFEGQGFRRVYIARTGPLGSIFLALLGGLILLAALVFLFGFLVLLIPVAGAIFAGAILASFLRGPRRWLR
jgi:hypothetical protein